MTAEGRTAGPDGDDPVRPRRGGVPVDSDPDDPAVTVDALGRRCPLPVIELARHIGDVEPGGVVQVLADDVAARTDIPAWCRMRGHDYLGERPAPGAEGGPPAAGGASAATGYLVRRRG